MTSRIPSSLVWLIDKRARIDGELRLIERKVAQLQSQLASIENLRENLAAFDTALKFHEIQVDVENISPILSRKHRLLNAPYGQLSKWILSYFRTAGDREIPSTEIFDFVANEAGKAGIDISNKAVINTSVRYRLKSLCERGIVIRCSHQIIAKGKVSTWRLATQYVKN